MKLFGWDELWRTLGLGLAARSEAVEATYQAFGDLVREAIVG
jgi:hypothetical protein